MSSEFLTAEEITLDEESFYMSIFDEETCAELAKILTVMCVRNTKIEDIHAGIYPATKTGDYSDVRVIDANGNEFSWSKSSRISDAEMKMLMKGIVDRLYTFMMQGDDPRFYSILKHYSYFAVKWDEPKIDPKLDCTKDRS